MSDGVLLTAQEVAELLGVSPAWVYAESRAGRLPTVTLGRYRRYRKDTIEDWIDALERASVKPATPQSGRATLERPRPVTGDTSHA
jgi:excisionase family DNA binding protein